MNLALLLKRLPKRKQCQAHALSSNRRCTKGAIFGTNYCWQHEAKLPVVAAAALTVLSVLWSATFKDRFLPSGELRELREWKQERRKHAELRVGLITSERDEVRFAKIRAASTTTPVAVEFPGLDKIPVVYLTNRVETEIDQTITVDRRLEHVLIPTKGETNIAVHFVLWNSSTSPAEDVELTANISTNLSISSTMPPWSPTQPVVSGCISTRTIVKETLLPGTEQVLPELLFLLKAGNVEIPQLVSLRVRAKNTPTCYCTFYVVFTPSPQFLSPVRAVAKVDGSTSNYVIQVVPAHPPSR